MCAAGAGGSEWAESTDGVWSESVPSPTFEWDSEALPTTSNWEEWNSYIGPDTDFAASEGIPFRVDDDDLFVGISDEEVSSSPYFLSGKKSRATGRNCCGFCDVLQIKRLCGWRERTKQCGVACLLAYP